MADSEIEIRPADFLTVGTVGPRGKRVFYIQGAGGGQLISLILEKIQVEALAAAINELMEDLHARQPLPGDEDPIDLADFNMELRDPIQPEFRVAQIGLGYDEASDLIVIVTQELLVSDSDIDFAEPRTVRFWCSRPLVRALAMYAETVVERGRPDPQKNGRIHYYWT